MKRIYYPEGPPKITAGIAGAFEVGKAKPVCNRLADQLLARPDFKEAGPDVPNMDGYDQLLAEAEAQDKIEVPVEQKASPKSKPQPASSKEATE